MSNLKHVNDDDEFTALMKSVGDDVAVVDFYTTWCGPCKQMEPAIQSLCMKYPRVLFLKVDADKCFETSMNHDVKGVPLFVIYMNKTVVDQVNGAHPQELDYKIKMYEQTHRHNNPSFSNSNIPEIEFKALSQVVSSIGRVQEITNFLDEKGCYCVNDLTPSSFNGFLNGKKLVSGKGSGKLVLVYSFKEKLMLHSFKIKARIETGPRVLRVFANHPKLLDFNVGIQLVPSQQIVLIPEDLDGEKLIEFRTGSFNLISNLQIFVTEPMTKGHRVEIESLSIFGAPVEMIKNKSALIEPSALAMVPSTSIGSAQTIQSKKQNVHSSSSNDMENAASSSSGMAKVSTNNSNFTNEERQQKDRYNYNNTPSGVFSIPPKGVKFDLNADTSSKPSTFITNKEVPSKNVSNNMPLAMKNNTKWKQDAEKNNISVAQSENKFSKLNKEEDKVKLDKRGSKKSSTSAIPTKKTKKKKSSIAKKAKGPK